VSRLSHDLKTFRVPTADAHRGKRGAARGLFVISLDFELYWGVRHLSFVRNYFKNLVGARGAIPALLELFRRYGIHSTWATVGFLFFDRTSALIKFAPTLRPRYANRKLSPYDDLPPAEARENSQSVFFAPSLIRQIAATDYQEIATHTFSHYYCLEQGQDIEAFRADLLAARAAARVLGVEVRSLVFAKNQCRNEWLSVCSELGIVAYRGTPSSWLYRPAPDDEQGRLRRLGRLLDAYLPISSHNCHPLPAWTGDLPLNVPASRYLRPYSPFWEMFDPLRLWRIKRDMTMAAKSGQLYHLWWHPHNFGTDLTHNLAFLEKILGHYRVLRDTYGMENLNMGEVADRCLALGAGVTRLEATIEA
jgi:peptidoglycan/xylan/chitin deacetylase (PgdA/CDA1 family)